MRKKIFAFFGEIKPSSKKHQDDLDQTILQLTHRSSLVGLKEFRRQLCFFPLMVGKPFMKTKHYVGCDITVRLVLHLAL